MKDERIFYTKRKELVITWSLKRHASGIIHHGNYIHQTPPRALSQTNKREEKKRKEK